MTNIYWIYKLGIQLRLASLIIKNMKLYEITWIIQREIVEDQVIKLLMASKLMEKEEKKKPTDRTKAINGAEKTKKLSCPENDQV